MEMGNKWLIRLILTLAVLAPAITGFSQTTPEVLNRVQMKDQVEYIEEHTKVYEGWRAIREDIYRKVIGNFTDSLVSGRKSILELQNLASVRKQEIDSLEVVLAATARDLDEVTNTKNEIKVFGISINKVTYNTIMFLIIASLVFMLGVGFLAFKRNLSVYLATKKELSELGKEFEEYRQVTRKAREKMSMDHFNEIRKMKGSQS